MNETQSHKESDPPNKSRAWIRRLGYALRGVKIAVLRESNFLLYMGCAVAVVAAGTWVGLSAERWAIAALATASVFVAEMFNSAIEHLARAVTRERHPEIRDALDVASGAVLIAAVGAAAVGAIILGEPLVELLR